MNVTHGNKGTPLVVFVNRKTSVRKGIEEDEGQKTEKIDWNRWIKDNVLDKIDESKDKMNYLQLGEKYGIKVFEGDLTNLKAGEGVLKESMQWLTDKM